jgi:hypothetical protein
MQGSEALLFNLPEEFHNYVLRAEEEKPRFTKESIQ